MNADFPDLFGNVRRVVKRGRGRPPHEPTDATRWKVNQLLIAGCPKVHIASAMKVTVKTLRTHYFRSKNREENPQ